MTPEIDARPEALAAAIAEGAAIDWADVELAAADRSQAALVHQLRVIDALRAQHAGPAHLAPWGTRAVTSLAVGAVALAAVKVLVGLAAMPRTLLDAATPSGVWPFALNLTVFGVGGLLLVFGGSRDRRLQLLGGFVVTLASAFVQPFLPAAGGTAGVIAGLLRAAAPESFAMLLVWQFAWHFPHPPMSRAGQRFGRAFVGLAAVASVLMFLAPLAAAYPEAAPGGVGAVLRPFKRNIPESFYWPLVFTLVLLAMVFLLVKGHRLGDDSRRRTRWFLAALGAGLLPVGVAVIATPFVPQMADPDVRRRISVVVYLGLLSLVPTTAFAVTVQRVMDLQFVIRTALQYALARYAIWTAIVAPLGYLALDVWVNRALTMQQFVAERRPAPLLALVGVALATLTYRAHLLRAVDRWFLREPAAWCPACDTVHDAETRHCPCGAETRPAELPLIVNGRFRIHRRLGAGSSGVVYLATDLALQRSVALKTLQPRHRGFAGRLRREARAMAAVRHPHLATIFGAEDWHGTPLLVVEYLEGGTLAETLARGPLSIAAALRLGTLLADVLERLHGAGVLHRDIKPSNIGFTAEGEPRLLDFGLAAMLDATAADLGTETIAGTPLYLAPEALAGEAPRASFDLWSLHVVVYEALAGQHPLRGRPVPEVIREVPRTPLPDLCALRPECPAAVAAYLAGALALDPARRPPDAATVRAALRDLGAAFDPA